VELGELLQERHWRRCAPDWDTSTPAELADAFQYFCENFWKIKPPGKPEQNFMLYDAQRESAEAFVSERYTIVLKARQIGFTTLVAAYGFWCGFFYENREIVVLSIGDREAKDLLGKTAHGWGRMPQWMKLRGPGVQVTQRKIAITNGSTIESLPTGSDPARGKSLWLIVMDEMAYIEHAREAWTAVEPTTDVGGSVILLSTANGEGNTFHELWVGAENKTNQFKPIFYPWSANGRSQEWYEWKSSNTEEWRMAQEYPDNPEDAFLRSGRPYFNVDLIRAWPLRDPQAEGFLLETSDGVEFRDQPDGALEVFEWPDVNKRYCIGCDVAEGLDHGDFSSVHVLNARDVSVAATWHGRVEPDVLGEDILFHLANWYHFALVGIESNNHGHSTIKAIQRRGYPYIYRDRRLNDIAPAPSERYGWHTTRPSKALAIDELAAAFRNGLEIPDEGTRRELRTFVREGNGKLHGSPHDDRVMSLAIANQMRHHVFLDEYTPKHEAPAGTFEWWKQRGKPAKKGKRTPIGATAMRSR
jgi:hypothetical protein